LIRAELVGDDKALACGQVAVSSTPLLALCRLLVAAGYDPATPLEAYRGETLCLTVRAIGEAARLEIGSHGKGFKLRPPEFKGEPESMPLLSGVKRCHGFRSRMNCNANGCDQNCCCHRKEDRKGNLILHVPA
jgi:hypothetical protein